MAKQLKHGPHNPYVPGKIGKLRGDLADARVEAAHWKERAEAAEAALRRLDGVVISAVFQMEADARAELKGGFSERNRVRGEVYAACAFSLRAAADRASVPPEAAASADDHPF